MTLQEKLDEAKKETLRFAREKSISSRFRRAKEIQKLIKEWMGESAVHK
jgi:hypothetical protein